jgi:hypothetical protein
MCFTLCFSQELLSQHDISKYEKRWAAFHPIAAIRIKSRLKKAMVVYHEVKDSKQLDNFESGGTLDAFRHSFSMAYLSQKIKTKKLRKLGIAHEKGNKYHFYKNKHEFGERADSLACEMDLRNNELGFLIGSKTKKLKINDLKAEMLLQIQKGNAWILKRNDKNEYVSCENEPIIMNNYKNVWFLPKCLIKSNE